MAHARGARPSVAIIGAGWAGLACALRLARAGFEPIVFESAPEPGGRARRAKLDDSYRDNGQHLMLAGCRALTSVIQELGLTIPCITFAYTDRRRSLSLANRTGRVGLLFALMQARGFSWSERWSLLRALLSLQRTAWHVPANQSVAQWLIEHKQPTPLITDFWEPLALAILNTPTAHASMSRLAPVLRDTLGAGTGALAIRQPHADLSASVVMPLVNAIIACGGQVRCGQRVTAIEVLANQRYALQFKDSDTQPSFDHIVLAVPPWSLAHIALPFAAASLAERFGAQPIATIYLGLERDVRLPAPLVQLAGPTPEDARVWAMDRAHCGEPGVIAVSLSAEGAWTQLDHDTLAQRCLEELQTHLGMHHHCHWHKVVIVQKATPAATPAAYLTLQERSPLPGLWLSGDWTHPTYPATLEAAVDAGFATAADIIAAHR